MLSSYLRQQYFRYRYKKEGAENYQYVDVVPAGTKEEPHYEVQDLKVGTRYTFSIKAYNSLGESGYTKDIQGVETKSKAYYRFCKYKNQ